MAGPNQERFQNEKTAKLWKATAPGHRAGCQCFGRSVFTQPRPIANIAILLTVAHRTSARHVGPGRRDLGHWGLKTNFGGDTGHFQMLRVLEGNKFLS